MSRASLLDAVHRQGQGVAFEDLIDGRPLEALLGDLTALDQEREHASVYDRIRACALAAALCRFHLQEATALPPRPMVPRLAWEMRLARRHAEALDILWSLVRREGLSRPVASELGLCYKGLQYDELTRLVRLAVRSSRGSSWLFRGGYVHEQPLRIHRRLLVADPVTGLYPVLQERTPVRLDLSHSGWSDIFYLAMERPEDARVLNISVDIALGRAGQPPSADPTAPITACLRVIDEPVIRLTAIDLGETRDIETLDQLFNFGADHLGLLKAAVVASGVVPPACDGTGQPLAPALRSLLGPGLGLELCSFVDGIPKGSRLAVSTNLLASLIAVLMRATQQIGDLEGGLTETGRRVIAARAILGEWLGGSGGGWQDSGGLWTGVKLITGVPAAPGDPEYGVARGRLLPSYQVLDLPSRSMDVLERSLLVFHGGMGANVGPILEQVTSKHLVGWRHTHRAREDLRRAFDEILAAVTAGDPRRLGRLTEQCFFGPLSAIIPAVNNAYTEALITAARTRFGHGYWGFLMLGGMSGGGMALFVDPEIRDRVEAEWPGILTDTARSWRHVIPFAIAPVLCRVAVNRQGTRCTLCSGREARMPAGYYRLHAPLLTNRERTAARRYRDVLNHVENAPLTPDYCRSLLCSFIAADGTPRPGGRGQPDDRGGASTSLADIEPGHQEFLRHEMLAGRISLQRNRLPSHALIEDATDRDLVLPEQVLPAHRASAASLLEAGAVGIVTLAGGLGSRWTGGAGTVKSLFPVLRVGGRWWSFLELHLAKARALRTLGGQRPLHIVTTSFLTHGPIAEAFAAWATADPDLVADTVVSRGVVAFQRLVPTVRDLTMWFEDLARSSLDEPAERVRAERHRAWLAWVADRREGSVYCHNNSAQALNPPGHWWEVPNLLLNGVLHRSLQARPGLQHLFLHNVDVLAAAIDLDHLARHVASGATLTYEVVPRLADDSGGALCRVDGRARLVEGLAFPDEWTQHGLSFYNSNNCWIAIDRLLAWFGLSRATLADPTAVSKQVCAVAQRLPIYLTIKEAKQPWGLGQADVVPVAQFEQLWGDMTALPDLTCAFASVRRRRGQQLKEIGQLDAWHLDGGRAEVAMLAGLEGG